MKKTGNQERITDVCLLGPWNRWHAELKLKNLESARDYAIKEFLTALPQLQAAVSDLNDAQQKAEKAKEPEADYLKQVLNEARRFLDAEIIVQDFQGNSVNQTKPDKEEDPVRIKVDSATGILSADIAFEAILILPENLHLVSCPKEQISAQTCSAVPVITLPRLYPRLLPGPVNFVDNNGSYQLVGERLRAVDKVRLEAGGDPILIKPIVGYNDVSFSLPQSEIDKIDAAKARCGKSCCDKGGCGKGRCGKRRCSEGRCGKGRFGEGRGCKSRC